MDRIMFKQTQKMTGKEKQKQTNKKREFKQSGSPKIQTLSKKTETVKMD